MRSIAIVLGEWLVLSGVSVPATANIGAQGLEERVRSLEARVTIDASAYCTYDNCILEAANACRTLGYSRYLVGRSEPRPARNSVAGASVAYPQPALRPIAAASALSRFSTASP